MICTSRMVDPIPQGLLGGGHVGTKQHVAHRGEEPVPCKCVHTCLHAECICEMLTSSFPLQSTGSTCFLISFLAVGFVSLQQCGLAATLEFML